MDWTGIPLEEFGQQHEFGEDGYSTGRMIFAHGEGIAQSVLARLAYEVGDTYADLLTEEDIELYEREGKAPIFRDGRRVYEPIFALTLADLPAVLDTLVVLEEEAKARSAEEAAHLEREAQR